MLGPKLPQICVEAPDHVPEREYEFKANYSPMNIMAQIYLESGSDLSAEEALDRLRFGLDELGLVPLNAAVDLDDIDEALEDPDAEPEEPAEGDYVIAPNSDLFQVGNFHQRPLFKSTDDYLDTWRFIMEHCRTEQFWPDVWSESDHGNLYLYKAEEYPRFEEDGREKEATA